MAIYLLSDGTTLAVIVDERPVYWTWERMIDKTYVEWSVHDDL
jgi:hypothetical protein